MLKNKIYNYLFSEIFKNFITILLTFTAISWTVRAVNFLDLMIEDGYSAVIYFNYTLLNISAIVTRFIPLSFLLAMIISISKFEEQKELLILWTAGLNKMKIANIFFLIGFIVAIFQIILSVIVNPFTLNQSRTLLRETEVKQVSSVLKSNDFSDAFKGITFYVGKKNINNELINVFIKDNTGSLSLIVDEARNSKNTTIFAEKGVILKNKLILLNGIIQTLNSKNEIRNIDFKKTELSIANFSNRTIKQPKIQETSSLTLLRCLKDSSQNCKFLNNKKIVVETLSRRMGMPLYIPLIALISSFLLIYQKEGKYISLKKYIIFMISFIILIFAEIILRYVGFSLVNFILYFLSPLILSIILYFLLSKTMTSEKIR